MRKNITWFKDSNSLYQIYNKGLEFAFFNGQGYQCHPFVFCKDFLQDAIWATLHKTMVTIYGFTYKFGVNPPLDLRKTRIALRLMPVNKDFATKCEKTVNFVNAITSDFGFEPTKLKAIGKFEKTGGDIFCLIGDRRWMFSPVLISFYTFCLRIGMTYEGGPWRDHFTTDKPYFNQKDNDNILSIRKVLDKLLAKPIKEIFSSRQSLNFPKKCNTVGLHNRSGIVAYAENKLLKELENAWKEKKDKVSSQ